LRVLCVDNDREVLAALDAALRSRGCEVRLTSSIDDALALAREFHPTAALIDYQLGEDQDGLDLAAALQAMDRAMTLALVTADQAVVDDPRIGELGVTLMSKPIDPNRLWSFLTDHPSDAKTVRKARAAKPRMPDAASDALSQTGTRAKGSVSRRR
jgi:DNA-binding response OmpR family regulator